MAWRNDPATRDASGQQDLIAAEDHERWLAAVLADETRDLLVGELAGRPIGQVRFDGRRDGRREISVALAPTARGRGIGRNLIRAGIGWLWATDPRVQVIEAWVREENHPSLSAFGACRFEQAETKRDGFVLLELRRG